MKLTVNEQAIFDNIRKAEEFNSPLLSQLIAIFEKAELTSTQRRAICMEVLISLDKRIHFNSFVRQFQANGFESFGFSQLVPIVEKIMLSYLAQDLIA